MKLLLNCEHSVTKSKKLRLEIHRTVKIGSQKFNISD
nr:MAG TPA: hypothetical protein [Herelleviridae sp.]